MGKTPHRDDDNPEWTDADFARARPFPEVFPELARKLRAQGGLPKLERPKVHVGFRLAAEVVEGIKPARATTPASSACCGTPWRKGNCEGRALAGSSNG